MENEPIVLQDDLLHQGETGQPDSGRNPVPPKPPRRTGKIVKRVLWILLLAILGYLIYWLCSIFLTADRNVQQVYLVPKDAALVIQSSEPVRDWQRFSRSEPWQKLRQAPSFAEIAARVGSLDSLVHANKTLLSLVGKRDLIVSIHKTRPDDWDFLIVVDMQKISKMDLLKDQIEQILKLGGSTVTQRRYNGINILEMLDRETQERLYLAFVDNHFVASYSPRLVEASIDEREKPQIGLDANFMDVQKLVAGKGLCRVYVNYAYLPAFLSIYLGEGNEYLDAFSQSMTFAGLYYEVDNAKMAVNGYSQLKDSANPYVTALLTSGKHKMRAHEILSDRTAFYLHIGFENASVFMQKLEQAFSQYNQASYDSYKTSREKIEKYLGISLEENFLSWMSGELALAQSEAGLLGRSPEQILAVRSVDIGSAREHMDLIEKRIRRRSPIKIKAVDYKGYEINYVEMKGFFRLFFGKLFDQFDTPYYTFVDDYVVFSNRASSLLSFIEDYEQKSLLKNSPEFKKALSNIQANSSIFVYLDMHKFYPQLAPPTLSRETWGDLEGNREVLYSFPQWTFQVVSEKQSASMQLVMDYKPYTPAAELSEIVTDEADEVLDEEAESEKELMNELKRFYVEKFQGNVLREFYEDGALLSESEIRNGQRHGRYREYYESGKLRLRGKYVNNRQKGTWKYYTEEGKFEKKEKF